MKLSRLERLLRQLCCLFGMHGPWEPDVWLWRPRCSWCGRRVG